MSYIYEDNFDGTWDIYKMRTICPIFTDYGTCAASFSSKPVDRLLADCHCLDRWQGCQRYISMQRRGGIRRLINDLYSKYDY